MRNITIFSKEDISAVSLNKQKLVRVPTEWERVCFCACGEMVPAASKKLTGTNKLPLPSPCHAIKDLVDEKFSI